MRTVDISREAWKIFEKRAWEAWNFESKSTFALSFLLVGDGKMMGGLEFWGFRHGRLGIWTSSIFGAHVWFQ